MGENRVTCGGEGVGRRRFSQLLSSRDCLKSITSFVAVGLSLLLTTYAQKRLDAGASPSLPVALYLIGALLFGFLFRHTGHENAPHVQEATDLTSFRLSHLYPGLTLALTSFAAFGENTFRPMGLLVWLGGLILCFAAIRIGAGSKRARGKNRIREVIRDEGLYIPWEWVILGLIVLIGAAFRLYRLDEIPADMGWDLPYNYFDADRILHGEYWIFFPHNLGREGLFFYLIALCSRFIGLSPYSIRLTSAIIGILTIPALYFLAKHIFNREIAFYATTFLAMSKWHIVLSRSGFRVILMPLCTTLVLYCLVRALSTHRAVDFAWLGIALGLGLYSYKAFLFVPPTVTLAVGTYLLLHKENNYRDLLKGLAVTLIISLLVYIPMVRYLWDNPQAYFQREAVQFLMLKRGFDAGGSLPSELLYNLRTSLLMFNQIGDGNSRFNVPFQRHLGFVSGVLFALGLGYALFRGKRGFVALLLVFWFLLILPMTVTMLPRETPNLFRSSGVIGPTLIIASLPLAVLRRWLAGHLPAGNRTSFTLYMGLESSVKSKLREWQVVLSFRWIPIVLVLTTLLWEGVESYHFYFADYVRYLPDVWNFSLTKEMARIIDEFTDGPVFVVAWPHWYDGNALRVELAAKGDTWEGELLKLDPAAPPLVTLRGKALFIIHPQDKRTEALLRELCPQGVFTSRSYPNGEIALRLYYCER